MSRGKNRIPQAKMNLIALLAESGCRPGAIARDLELSRTTIYYHLHPGKRQQKVDYVRRFRAKHAWEPEASSWELESG